MVESRPEDFPEEDIPEFTFEDVPESVEFTFEDVPESVAPSAAYPSEHVVEPAIEPEPGKVIGADEVRAADGLHVLLDSLPNEIVRPLISVIQQTQILEQSRSIEEYVERAMSLSLAINSARKVLQTVKLDEATNDAVYQHLYVLDQAAERAREEAIRKDPELARNVAKKEKVEISEALERATAQKREEANLELSDGDRKLIHELMTRDVKEFHSDEEKEHWKKIFFEIHNYVPEDKWAVLAVDRFYGNPDAKRSRPSLRERRGEHWTPEQRRERLEEIAAYDSGLSIEDAREIRAQEKAEMDALRGEGVTAGNPLAGFDAETTIEDYKRYSDDKKNRILNNLSDPNYLAETKLSKESKDEFHQLIDNYKIAMSEHKVDVSTRRVAARNFIRNLLPVFEKMNEEDPESVPEIADDVNVAYFMLLQNLPEAEELVKVEPAAAKPLAVGDLLAEEAMSKANADFLRNYAREQAKGVMTLWEPDPYNPRKKTRIKVVVPGRAEQLKELRARRAKDSYEELRSDKRSLESLRKAKREAEKRKVKEWAPGIQTELTRREPEVNKEYRVKQTEREVLLAALERAGIDVSGADPHAIEPVDVLRSVAQSLLEEEQSDERRREIGGKLQQVWKTFSADRARREQQRGKTLDPKTMAAARKPVVPHLKEITEKQKQQALGRVGIGRVSKRGYNQQNSDEHSLFRRITGLGTIPADFTPEKEETEEAKRHPGFNIGKAKVEEDQPTTKEVSRLGKAIKLLTDHKEKTLNNIEKLRDQEIEAGGSGDEVEAVIRKRSRNWLIGKTLPTLNDYIRVDANGRIVGMAAPAKFLDELKDKDPITILDKVISRLERLKELQEEGELKLAAARTRLTKLAELEKEVTEHGSKLEITEPLLEDLISSIRGTMKSLHQRIDSVEKSKEKEKDLPKKEIQQIRDFSGNLALLCNMILNGESYSREERMRALKDMTY